MTKEIQAAHEYLLRKHGYSKPSGRTDNGGRWYPDPTESCDCCNHVRAPSRAWPWPIFKHCFSLYHVANLYEADSKEVRKLCRKKNLPLLIGISKTGDKIIEKIIKEEK